MKRPRLIASFKNIRVLPSGYQVTVVRQKREFSKHFAGHTARSLREANAYRDLLLRTLPSKRRRDIPKHVLNGAGLKEQVVGVFRYAERHFYQVTFTDKKGVIRGRTFYWKDRAGEIAAYKKAVAFRRSIARGKK